MMLWDILFSVLFFSTPSFYKPFYSLYGDGKESACNAGDPGSIPGLGRSPGEGNGKPLQYSCLENPMGGGTWQATVHGVAKTHFLFGDIYLFFYPFPTFKGDSSVTQHATSL